MELMMCTKTWETKTRQDHQLEVNPNLHTTKGWRRNRAMKEWSWKVLLLVAGDYDGIWVQCQWVLLLVQCDCENMIAIGTCSIIRPSVTGGREVRPILKPANKSTFQNRLESHHHHHHDKTIKQIDTILIVINMIMIKMMIMIKIMIMMIIKWWWWWWIDDGHLWPSW